MSDGNVSLNTPDKDAKRKRRLAWGIILGVVLVLAILAMSTKKPVKRDRAPTWTSPAPVETSDKVLSKIQAAVDSLSKKIVQMEKDQKNQRAKDAEEKADMVKKFQKSLSESDHANGGMGPVKETNIIGKDAPINSRFEDYIAPPIDDGSAIIKKAPPAPPPLERINVGKVPVKNQITNIKKKKSQKGVEILDGNNHEDDAFILTNNKQPARSKLVKNPNAGMLPAMSMAEIVLVTGIDAIASGSAKGNPEPVHFRVQDNAWLAGDARYLLANCMGQAVGYGDLSTTRAKLLATRLVCVNTETNTLLETEIAGFIADSDGTIGMRGPIQNREGQIAAKAFAAAFAEGASSILAASGVETTTLGTAAVTSTNTADALEAGLAGGTSKASEMLAERYIEQMEAIAPTIEVRAGRRGTLHFTEGQKLEWKVYQGAYTHVITPDGK